MNKDQLQYFVKSESIPVTIGVHDISNTPRTLLYGVDFNGRVWHTYVNGGIIHLYVYSMTWFETAPKHYEASNFWLPSGLLHLGKLHPEYCDLEFCKKLRSLGAVLKFSHYLEPDRQGPFYGRLR